MKTIAISIQKGGTGKTTSALCLAYGLTERGKKVLLIDGDPQSNATAATVGVVDGKNLYDVLQGNARGIKDTLKTVRLGLDVTSVGLSATDADFTLTQLGREYLLRDALKDIRRDYDYCIIDTPPSLGILTMNALTAADSVLIPCELDNFALQGLVQLSGFIRNIQRYSNAKLKVLGLIITKYNQRAQLSKALMPVLSQVTESLHIPVICDIPASADLAKSRTVRASIYEYAPKSRAAVHYEELTDYIIQKEG